jgi:hypothetical protein
MDRLDKIPTTNHMTTNLTSQRGKTTLDGSCNECFRDHSAKKKIYYFEIKTKKTVRLTNVTPGWLINHQLS